MDDQSGKISLSPNLLQQFRQLSIPLWARALVLFLVLGVFVADLAFLLVGALSGREKWLETAGAIFGATFVPTLFVVYLAFAETGVVALRRKTTDLLDSTLPKSLRAMGDALGAGELTVHTLASEAESPSRHYRVRFVEAGGVPAELYFSLDVNVYKANVGLWIPAERAGKDAERIVRSFGHTLEGARREGYEFNAHPARASLAGRDYCVLVLIKRLPQDFLWDPGQKLYFAQDLRFFVASALREGQEFFARDVP